MRQVNSAKKLLNFFSNSSPLWSPTTNTTTTTPQTVTAWKSYGSYCISIHWKEGIAPGNSARTVRPAPPDLEEVWDDQTDAPRRRRNAIDMSKEGESWSFDLLLIITATQLLIHSQGSNFLKFARVFGIPSFFKTRFGLTVIFVTSYSYDLRLIFILVQGSFVNHVEMAVGGGLPNVYITS